MVRPACESDGHKKSVVTSPIREHKRTTEDIPSVAPKRAFVTKKKHDLIWYQT